MYLEKYQGPLYLLGAFTLAGTSVIAARFVADRLGTFTITAASLFFALLVLLPLCREKLIKARQTLSAKDCLFLALQAFCGMFLFRMFLLNGLRHTSTGEAGILTGATPAITALLALFFLREPAGGKGLIGIISTVTGILLIQGLLTPTSSFTLEHFWGNILVICAAACESLFSIFSRLAVNTGKEPVEPVVQTTIVSAIAMLFCLIPAIFEHPISSLAAIGVKEWLALLWYGLFVTALAFIFWYNGIKRCGAFTAAAFSGMMPFTAMLLSIILLRETPGWQQWSGGILIVAGMILIGREQYRSQ